MSNTTPSSNGSSTAPAISLSWLERAWEVQWALRLACGVLFLDLAQLLWTGQGLMAWSKHSDGLLQDLAFLAVTLAGFALVMSLVLPMLGAIVRWIGWEVITLLPSVQFSAEEHRGRPLGYVAERDLLELALRENNSFLLDWYHRHVTRRQEQDAFMQTLGDLVFGCLVLAMLDGALPLIGTGDDSLIASAMAALQDHVAPVVLAVLAGGLLLLKRVWFPSYTTHWIYYPPLDLELREKVRKARDRL
ncbi:hypothetical protein [Pseudomonas sp. FYR_11]|uniref:hypothetical protein n=1 Tax=Pseudomonas TaxID=286 RepID=UPI00370BA377